MAQQMAAQSGHALLNDYRLHSSGHAGERSCIFAYSGVIIGGAICSRFGRNRQRLGRRVIDPGTIAHLAGGASVIDTGHSDSSAGEQGRIGACRLQPCH